MCKSLYLVIYELFLFYFIQTTDIAQHALDALVKSKVKKVVLIGRRGPVQTSFTIKELREIINLKGCRTIMSKKDFDGVPEIMESK